MALIGTRAHAVMVREIANGTLDHKDFEYIGGGSMRDCYLHKPTNVVYKIQTWEYDRGYTNSTELRNARVLLKKSFTHVRIPKTSGFTVDGKTIVAMELVKGVLGSNLKPTDATEARKELHEACRFEDMHGENFIIDEDGKAVPVDMGSPRRKSLDRCDRRVLTCGEGSAW